MEATGEEKAKSTKMGVKVVSFSYDIDTRKSAYVMYICVSSSFGI